MEITKEYTGEELFKIAKELLSQGKELDKAFHYFNLLANNTVKSKKHQDVLLFHMGAVAMKQGNHSLSLILFNEAMKYRDNFIEAHNNIGYTYKELQMHGEALASFEKAHGLALKYPEHVSTKDKADYLTNIGSMYIANGTPKKAIECFDQALAIDPDNMFGKWNRSLANLELGNYESGFAEYDFGERQERVKNRTYGIKDFPLWDGVPDKNKTVVVLGEQGIGDEIMFASIIPDLVKDCKVIIDGHPRLADLFRLNFPNVLVFGTRKTDKVTWPLLFKPDAVIGMGSLARYYRKKKEDFPGTPYLIADPKRTQKYAEKLKAMGDKPKIGISWKGGTDKTGRENRKIPLALLKELLAIDVDFISLQYDKNMDDEIKKIEEETGKPLNHWQRTLNDYDETAALVANLDLVISVPQSVIHLAGALGTPTFQLVPFKALWQAGVYQEDLPWYSCVKNYWQDEKCDWEPVIKRVKEDLCNLLQKSIAA